MSAIFLRDFKGIASSAAGIIFSVAYLLTSGTLFTNGMTDAANMPINTIFYAQAKALMFLCPLLLTGSFSGEYKNGTWTLLYSSPVSTTQIILGKFCAVYLYALLVMLVTVLYLPILSFYRTVNAAEMLAVYFALAMLIAAFVSIAMFVATVSSTPLTAYIAGAVNLFVFYMIDAAIPLVSDSGLAWVLEVCSIFSAYESISSGILGISAVIRLVSVSVAFLFAARLALELRYRKGRDE